MKHNILTLTLYEIVGTTWISLIVFTAKWPETYYVAAPLLAIPAGSLLDLLGWLFFSWLRKTRKWKFSRFSNQRKNDDKIKNSKSEDMLFMVNINRSFFIIMFSTAFVSFASWNDHWLLLPIFLSMSLICF